MEKDHMNKKHQIGVLRLLGRIVLVLVLIIACLFAWLTIAEYQPEAQETLETAGEASQSIEAGSTLRVVTWNCGYGALGSNADFFMDGGTSVFPSDKERVQENLEGIADTLKNLDADFMILQEVDRNSARSYSINEEEYLREQLGNPISDFAYNYKVPFIPYPIPPMGKVESGILSMSASEITSAVRHQLPVPFSWPERLGNLKRCAVVNTIPISGSTHSLVLVNLHLEAYDDGEGKAAQTAMLKEILEEQYEAGNYVIAGGDFNQTFCSADLSAYPLKEGMWKPGIIEASDFDEGWQLCMDPSVPTCRSLDKALDGADVNEFQFYVIDGFIVSPNVTVHACHTEDAGFQNTDHNPVILDFTLN